MHASHKIACTVHVFTSTFESIIFTLFRKLIHAESHYNFKLMRRCVLSWWALTLSHRLHKDSHRENIKDKVIKYLTERNNQNELDLKPKDIELTTPSEVTTPSQTIGPLDKRANEIAIQTDKDEEGGASQGVWLKAKHHVVSYMYMSTTVCMTSVHI